MDGFESWSCAWWICLGLGVVAGGWIWVLELFREYSLTPGVVLDGWAWALEVLGVEEVGSWSCSDGMESWKFSGWIDLGRGVLRVDDLGFWSRGGAMGLGSGAVLAEFWCKFRLDGFGFWQLGPASKWMG